MLFSTRYADAIGPFQSLCVPTMHLLHQAADVYRSKLRDDFQGVQGDEVLRRRVEDFVNLMRPSGVLVSTFIRSYARDVRCE